MNTHRCATKGCPFNAPPGEDHCDLCRDFAKVMGSITANTQRLINTRQSLGLAFTLAGSRMPVVN